MTDETRARFLAAIAAQLPADRIAEVHLFPAIRQGGMESGVAVVAVEPMQEPAVGAETPVAVAPESQPAVRDAAEPDAQPTENELAASADEPVTAVVGDVEALDTNEREPLDSDDAESPYADEAEALEADAPSAPPPRRYTVFSARYRHTLKGPDRGKWETNVVEEADAPLLTVDAVVRGVQRRSGDVDEIVRLSGEEVRAALPTAERQGERDQRRP